MHAFIPFLHGPTKYDYSRIRDIHIQSRDASLEHHTKSHPNTLQLYISPAGGGCFHHSRRILEALELPSSMLLWAAPCASHLGHMPQFWKST